MSPSPARQPPDITTTRALYALLNAEPNGPAKHHAQTHTALLQMIPIVILIINNFSEPHTHSTALLVTRT